MFNQSSIKDKAVKSIIKSNLHSSVLPFGLIYVFWPWCLLPSLFFSSAFPNCHIHVCITFCLIHYPYVGISCTSLFLVMIQLKICKGISVLPTQTQCRVAKEKRRLVIILSIMSQNTPFPHLHWNLQAARSYLHVQSITLVNLDKGHYVFPGCFPGEGINWNNCYEMFSGLRNPQKYYLITKNLVAASAAYKFLAP